MRASDPRYLMLLLSVVQVMLGLGLAWLFRYYYRSYPRPHLRLWSLSFLAQSAALAIGTVGILLMTAPDALPPGVRLSITLTTQVFSYLHIALLVLGTLGLRSEPGVSPQLSRALIGAALVLGAVAALAFVGDPSAARERAFARVSVLFLFTGAAYLGTALALLAEGAWRDQPIGLRVVGVSFFLYGAMSLGNFITSASPQWSTALMAVSHWFSVLDLAAEIAIGLGLVLWLHEDERTRAERAAQEVSQLTYYDGVTGLPNRRYLVDQLAVRLQRLAGKPQPLAVLVVRADRVRQLRDAMGDIAVARLLARSAQILRSEANDAEPLVARIEEDRLAVVFPAADVDELVARARRLRARLSQPARVEGIDASLPHSLGVALYPEDATQPEALVAAAVSAQARAEAEGGNRWEFFSRDIGERERAHLTLVAQLRAALADNEVELYFQPIVDLRTQRIAAVEALIRWRHSQRGMLEPAEFLAAAELHGMMPEIDRYVLRRACRDIATLGDLAVPVAINVSTQSFELSEFPEWLSEAMANARLSPDLVELEITEAAALQDPVAASTTLERLHARGVRVSLDDFGVGYSSMSQLKFIDADRLKIDRSFTTDVELGGKDAAIVATLITLGQRLGMSVIAEGVETGAQLEFYVSHGCDFAQGYLLFRPQELSSLRHLLATQLAAATA